MRRTSKRTTAVSLTALPLVADEVWEGAVGALTAELHDHETSEPYRLGLAMWVIAGEGEILASRVATPEAGAAVLLEMLLQAMRDPEVGKPRRPGTVRAREPELLRLLHDALAPLGVAVVQAECLRSWDGAFNFLDASLSPSVSGYRPITEPHAVALAGLFEAAAAFYRAAPWRCLGERRPIGLSLPSRPHDMFTLLVMGTVPAKPGLIIFGSLEVLDAFHMVLLGDRLASLEETDLPRSLSVTFVTADHMPKVALHEARERGWELAAPDAYPLVMVTEPGVGFVTDLSPQRLVVVTTALRAVTQFWTEAEVDLRAGKPAIIREVVIDLAGSPVAARVSCPPSLPGPRQRQRKPPPGPRGRR